MKASHIARLILIAGTVLVVASCGEEGTTVEPTSSGAGDPAAAPSRENEDVLDLKAGGLPFADSEIFLEFNSTDNDLGVQIFLDGVAWNRVKIFSPDDQKILDIHAKNELNALGLTELRFESAEPSPGEVLGLFAPGEYTFAGRATDGSRLMGDGDLSHHLPAPPEFTPSGGESVDHTDLVIRWKSVSDAEHYQVIVANEDTDLAMEVDLAGDVEEMRVPESFLEPGADYKAEVLAIAENGNKTITEGFFSTLP